MSLLLTIKRKHSSTVNFLLLIVTIINSSIALAIDPSLLLIQEPIQPLPLKPKSPLDFTKIALGKKLFEDPFLSHDNKISCAQCHQVNQGGDDGLYRSITNNGDYDAINSPSIFNLCHNIRLMWSGELKTLDEQIIASLHNPSHGNTTWKELLPKLENHADYPALFNQVYGHKKLTKEMLINAIVVYEQSLVTPNAPFDKYLRGDKKAISEQAKQGYQLFKNYGCSSCHQGQNVGGNFFQKFGIFGNYFEHRGNITKTDYGRFNVTGLEKDRYVFRVPSLRNVAITAPYFHDGSTKTLEKAIDIMTEHQLGRSISKQDKENIIAFLKTLTGEYQGKSLSRKEK